MPLYALYDAPIRIPIGSDIQFHFGCRALQFTLNAIQLS